MSLRNISEQVDTTGAELGFPGMADKTPFPASSQVSRDPLSQHKAHTTDIPLAVPKLSAASGAVQTTNRQSIPPQAQAKPPSSCGFDSGNRWRACAQGRGWGRWVAGIAPSPQDPCWAPRQCGSKYFKGKVISKANLSPAGVVLMLFDVLPAGGFSMTPLLIPLGITAVGSSGQGFCLFLGLDGFSAHRLGSWWDNDSWSIWMVGFV